MSAVPFERQGCHACRAAWNTPSREPLIFQGTDYELHAHLHQCGRCGTYWEEGERSASAVSPARATEFLLGVQIDEKVREVLDDLTQAFYGPEVVYAFANDLHKFRVEGRPPHWLYFSREFVDDHSSMEISRFLPTDELVEELKHAEQSRWLFIGEHGMRDVDDAFGRGHAL